MPGVQTVCRARSCRDLTCLHTAAQTVWRLQEYTLLDMAGASKAVTETDRTYKSTTALLKWLGNHGVGKRKARQFLIRSGCDSLESMAIFLRFQLPPLEFANEDCVNVDMHNMFGVNPRNAKRIIVDLDVVRTLLRYSTALMS